jgi:hypothetical protein
MPLKTAPSLFLGLGARVLLDTLNRTEEHSVSDYVLVGAWQGVGLYYTLMESPALAFVIAFAIGAKLLIEFTLVPDVMKCAVTLLGVALGVMFTDVLSQILEDGSYSQFGGKGIGNSAHTSSKSRPRAVSSSHNKHAEKKDTRRDRDRDRDRERERIRLMHADITAPSLDSTSDWLDRTARTPLEREVAALRARASLADTEKRRFKEERVWALAQGNQARAEQMSWQVKRYRALTQSFHKEADAKLLEGKNPKPGPSSSRPVASSRPRQSTSGRQASAPTDRQHRFVAQVDSEVETIVPIGYRRHRKQSSGTLRTPIRPNKFG